MAENKGVYNLLAFPNGPICNLECEYCYYLEKKDLYPEEKNFKMSVDVLEELIKQYFASEHGPEINFAWQGGEPLLRGIDFFRVALDLQRKYNTQNKKVNNILQTNGTLINKEWAEFFSENNFLIGISIDGNQRLHDAYRKDKNGNSTHQKVISGLELLKKNKVDFNVLCTVNNKNIKYPLEVYKFFKDMDVNYLQFIPIIKVENSKIGEHTISNSDYSHFLIRIFDEWILNDIGSTFVQFFEECITAWMGYTPSLCIFANECGLSPVIEHNGDVYSCDHFVSEENKLGNIMEKSIETMVFSNKQKLFGKQKSDIKQECKECKYYFICKGGCIRSRTPDIDEKGKEYLCEAHKTFFGYIDKYMKVISKGIKMNINLDMVKTELRYIHSKTWNELKRNDQCICGSGLKYKNCCKDFT